jgi:hypothetical protein
MDGAIGRGICLRVEMPGAIGENIRAMRFAGAETHPTSDVWGFGHIQNVGCVVPKGNASPELSGAQFLRFPLFNLRHGQQHRRLNLFADFAADVAFAVEAVG